MHHVLDFDKASTAIDCSVQYILVERTDTMASCKPKELVQCVDPEQNTRVDDQEHHVAGQLHLQDRCGNLL